MTYDPFARGQHPVGVRTVSWTDTSRGRTLPVEIYYPADDRHRGQDLDPAAWDTYRPIWVTESEPAPEEMAYQAAVRDAAEVAGGLAGRPLVLQVHGWAGFRQEASFLGTHLASHGYVVVSPDVILSTFGDVDALLAANAPRGTREVLEKHFRDIAHARKGDTPFLISTAIESLRLRADGVGITGASYGGWHSLMAPSVDGRVAASVPIVPAGSDQPGLDGSAFWREERLFDWKRDAATLMLVADRDSLLPLYGQLKLLRQVPATSKRMVVLADADHNHSVDDVETGQAWLGEFCERVGTTFPDGPGDWSLMARSVQPMARLVPGEVAKLAWRGLATAHFDAHLRDVPEARAFWTGSTDRILAELGIAAYTVELQPS